MTPSDNTEPIMWGAWNLAELEAEQTAAVDGLCSCWTDEDACPLHAGATRFTPED